MTCPVQVLLNEWQEEAMRKHILAYLLCFQFDFHICWIALGCKAQVSGDKYNKSNNKNSIVTISQKYLDFFFFLYYSCKVAIKWQIVRKWRFAVCAQQKIHHVSPGTHKLIFCRVDQQVETFEYKPCVYRSFLCLYTTGVTKSFGPA